jgi:hypothetical protein
VATESFPHDEVGTGTGAGGGAFSYYRIVDTSTSLDLEKVCGRFILEREYLHLRRLFQDMLGDLHQNTLVEKDLNNYSN